MDYKELLKDAIEYVKDNRSKVHNARDLTDLILEAADSILSNIFDKYEYINIMQSLEKCWWEERTAYGSKTYLSIAKEMIDRALIQDLNLEFIRKSKYDIPVWEEWEKEEVEDERG